MNRTDFSSIVAAAVNGFLSSNNKRSFKARNNKRYTLEIRRGEAEEGNVLVVTTWGYDNEIIPLPATPQQAKQLHTKNLLDMIVCPEIKPVANNLYYDIMRRVTA